MSDRDYIETTNRQGETKHPATSRPAMEQFGIVDENGDVISWLQPDGQGGVEVEHESGQSVRVDEDGVYVQKISADDALNSEIGDSVDYLDPQWLVRSQAWVNRYQHTDLADFNIFVSGSGGVKNEKLYYGIFTGTTDGSKSYSRRSHSHTPVTVTWEKDRVIATEVWADFTSSGVAAITAGQFDKGDRSSKHIGVAFSNGDLVGTVGDGSSETTNTLVSGAATGNGYEIFIDYRAGERVDFYVDGRDTVDGSVSAGLPSGKDYASKVGLTVWNADSGGSNNELHTSQFDQVQAP